MAKRIASGPLSEQTEEGLRFGQVHGTLAAILAEREACAKVAIKISDACAFKKLSDGYWAGVEIRDAIRARSAADNGGGHG